MLILKYLQLPFHFDEVLMQEEVALLANTHWQMHYQKLHYEGEWSAIPLRSIGGKADHIIISPENEASYADTVFLQDSPYLQTVLKTFQCPLMSVRLLKLNAGAVIKEHRDADLSFEKGEIRLHIPVITHNDVEFCLDKERITLKNGECWYMNFNLPHHIHNKSNIDRIHLVIDALVNEWVTDLFAQSSVNKKEITPPDHDDDTKLKIIESLRLLNTETSNRMADDMAATLEKQRG